MRFIIAQRRPEVLPRVGLHLPRCACPGAAIDVLCEAGAIATRRPDGTWPPDAVRSWTAGQRCEWCRYAFVARKLPTRATHRAGHHGGGIGEGRRLFCAIALLSPRPAAGAPRRTAAVKQSILISAPTLVVISVAGQPRGRTQL